MNTNPMRFYTVVPSLPVRLNALHKIALNLWWCWNHQAVELFRRINPDQFELVDHSPVRLLNQLSQKQTAELLSDEGFLNHMDRVEQDFDRYMSATTWFQEHYSKDKNVCRIAYFSAEFGIHESIPVYSGGLGVLAGDHLKAASDIGIPLYGVGLMYREGYFRQYLNADGWQQERYPENDFFGLPAVQVLDKSGHPLVVKVHFPGRDVLVKVWQINVGRVPLLLLDTNIIENQQEDRAITARLYGGDTENRIRQEVVLGMAGAKVLHALGIDPTVFHMNEGHSAFSCLERIRCLMTEKNIDFHKAREAVSAGTVFTTHTPVPAGNDRFSPAQIEHYFGGLMSSFGMSKDEFLGLGRENPSDTNETFCMTVLAVRLSNVSNGVSKLHGEVSRNMWKNIWNGLLDKEVPITSVTNGVHTSTWVSPDMVQLYDRYLGAGWGLKPNDETLWKRIDSIPDAELWRTHERRRERLVSFTRRRLKMQLKNRAATSSEISRADEILDPEALTIGFARRFATYKRGALIFKHLDRLAALVNNKDRPVQILFAGKAHPQDNGGKELIAEIVHMTKRAEFKHRVVFLEDYEMNVARYMVQGVDVWLNNPRRPLEASGTSGMKVAVNGGLNLSILDGWWCEGFNGQNGWAIGAGEEYSDLEYQDEVESRAIYDLLEQEIVPLFYNRSTDGLPRGWIKMMKNAISTLAPVFSTSRMVAEYTKVCYWPSSERYNKLSSNNFQGANDLAQWRHRLHEQWRHLGVHEISNPQHDPHKVGAKFHVKAKVHLGQLTPADVDVQIYYGPMDSNWEIQEIHIASMKHEKQEHHEWIFTGEIPCNSSGQHGYRIRVLPKHPDLANQLEPGLILWS